MNIQTLRNYLNKSRTIRGEVSRLSRELIEEFREEKSEINQDRDLSTEGRNKQIGKLQAKYERKILELARELQKQDKEAISNAKKGAESLIISDLPKVDEKNVSFLIRLLKNYRRKFYLPLMGTLLLRLYAS